MKKFENVLPKIEARKKSTIVFNLSLLFAILLLVLLLPNTSATTTDYINRWEFDSNLNDDGGLANWTAYGTPIYNTTDKKSGSASLNFDHTDAAGIYQDTYFDTIYTKWGTSGYTISAWYKFYDINNSVSHQCQGAYRWWFQQPNPSGDNDNMVFVSPNSLSCTQQMEFDYTTNGISSSLGVQIPDLDVWYLITFVFYANGTVKIYRDAALENQSSACTQVQNNGSTWDTYLGRYPVDGYSAFGGVDNMRLWNRTLSPEDINELYYGIPIIVALNSPINDTNISSSSQTFNCSADPNSSLISLTNITLYIWNNSGNIHFQETKELSGTTYNSTTWIVTNLTDDNYKWNCLAYNNVSSSYWGDENWILNVDTIAPKDIIINSPSHTIYNTSNISLNYSFTEITPFNCWYSLNGEANTTIGGCINTTIFATKNINNITVCMNDSAGNENCSAAYYFDVGWFGLCNGSTYPSLNFTFKDEINNSAINGTINLFTLNYWISSSAISSNYNYVTGLVNNENYTFCIYPNWTSMSSNYNISFSGTDYPQRRYYGASQALSNTTKQQTFYLVPASGIYSTIAVITIASKAIPGALVTLERQINNIWTIVTQDFTDSAGTVTFFVDPNSNYRITIVKEGYATQQLTMRLTQSIYSIKLGTEVSEFISPSWMEGITYSIRPPSGFLEPGIYNFTLMIRAINNNLDDCMFDLWFVNGTSWLNATGCNSSGGTLVIPDVNFTQNLYGRVSIEINGTWYVLESYANWKNVTFNITGNIFTTLADAIRDAINLPEWGENPQTADFNKIVFFFFMTALMLAVLNYYTGYDAVYPGMCLYVITAIVFVLSIANGILGHGFFYLEGFKSMGTRLGDFVNNWIIFGFFALVSAGNLFSTMRRQQQQ